MHSFRSVVLGLWLAASGAPLLVSAAPAPLPKAKSHREQNALVHGWIQQRFGRLLPDLMRRHGIDLWIVVSREYNDDPVFRSMAPLTTYASRRRTILVFHDLGPSHGVERLSVGRFDYDRLYTVRPTANDGQWAGLERCRSPRTAWFRETNEAYSSLSHKI